MVSPVLGLGESLGLGEGWDTLGWGVNRHVSSRVKEVSTSVAKSSNSKNRQEKLTLTYGHPYSMDTGVLQSLDNTNEKLRDNEGHDQISHG